MASCSFTHGVFFKTDSYVFINTWQYQVLYPIIVMQVVHIAFTYLCLTLIYFHLECKVSVEIPESALDSALALRGKERDIVREKL